MIAAPDSKKLGPDVAAAALNKGPLLANLDSIEILTRCFKTWVKMMDPSSLLFCTRLLHYTITTKLANFLSTAIEYEFVKAP